MGVKHWNVMSWNIRGINSDKKWNAIHDRLDDNNCDVLCLQETKRESFDLAYLRNFCSSSFDSFVFLPLLGASGGSVIIWKSLILSGTMVFQNSYSTSVEFTSLHNNVSWVLTNVYAPCTPQGKREFIHWFKHIHMPY
jgi:exonuclease III